MLTLASETRDHVHDVAAARELGVDGGVHGGEPDGGPGAEVVERRALHVPTFAPSVSTGKCAEYIDVRT